MSARIDGNPIEDRPSVSDWISDQAVEDMAAACDKASAAYALNGRYDVAESLMQASQYLNWSWEKLCEAGVT